MHNNNPINLCCKMLLQGFGSVNVSNIGSNATFTDGAANFTIIHKMAYDYYYTHGSLRPDRRMYTRVFHLSGTYVIKAAVYDETILGTNILEKRIAEHGTSPTTVTVTVTF